MLLMGPITLGTPEIQWSIRRIINLDFFFRCSFSNAPSLSSAITFAFHHHGRRKRLSSGEEGGTVHVLPYFVYTWVDYIGGWWAVTGQFQAYSDYIIQVSTILWDDKGNRLPEHVD